jgi:hypothetical protein
MLLRIAVRAVESWLLADHASFATFFSIPEYLVPSAPDELRSPKQTVLDLAARSKSRSVRDALLPAAGGWRTGRGYPGHLMQFIQTSWRIDAAKEVSPSLRRCVDALIALQNPETP